MASIYNIQQDLYAIIEIIEENEGIVDDELLQQLSITEAEFKNKIEAYTNVIKSLETDITAIKEEKARLDSLKVSKEKTIDRLKKVIVEAINAFGDTAKSGSKFIDYGTGKVSIRKSESIEVDDDKLESFAKGFVNYCNWLQYQNTFDQTDNHINQLLSYCLDNQNVQINDDELVELNADLSLKVNFKELLQNDEGKAFLKSLLNYNKNFKAKPSVDKKAIKDKIKEEGICPSFAEYVIKQNVVIK